MKRVLNAEQMREVDAAAGRDFGMPASVLMENAGQALTRAALDVAGARGRFVIVCGSGNNGGDGLVVARKLHQRGREVHVQLCALPDRLEGEPARNHQALLAYPVPLQTTPLTLELGEGDVVVDALFGTGLNRAPSEEHARAIGQMARWRKSGAKVVSADVPSGLSSDSGQPFEPCVEADVTVSFGYLKLGQVIEPGASLSGRLHVEDIGIPVTAVDRLPGPRVELLEEADVRSRLLPRSVSSHKGTYGHVLLVAGSWGKSGAAALAGLAALQSGAGLVSVATRPETLIPVLAHAPELMGVELVADGPLGDADLNSLLEAADGKQALVVGPGIARGPDTGKLIAALLEELSLPCVIDADGLNALEGNVVKLLERAKGPLVLTPHPGEMARLLGLSIPLVQADRVEAARTLASRHNAIVLLKGARTLIAFPDGQLFVNPTGNAGMATGGTGDVLAGMCGAFLAQGLKPEDAALVAPYAHGLAGDLAVQKTGQLGLIASDVVNALGDVWCRWQR